jgi:hypothetical protein
VQSFGGVGALAGQWTLYQRAATDDDTGGSP